MEKTINVAPFLNNRWFEFFVHKQRKNKYKVKKNNLKNVAHFDKDVTPGQKFKKLIRMELRLFTDSRVSMCLVQYDSLVLCFNRYADVVGGWNWGKKIHKYADIICIEMV